MKIEMIETLTIGQYWGGVVPSQAASVQGTMDGACGPYALLNMLVLGGHIEFKQLDKVWNTKPDGRSKFGKWQQTCGPLLLHGTEIGDLQTLLTALNPQLPGNRSHELLQVVAPRKHEEQKSEAANNDVLLKMHDFLKEHKQPLLVGIAGPHINHWTVAVGFQTHVREGRDEVAKILLIDPSEPVPHLHAWNATLSLGHQGDRRLRFLSMSDSEGRICSVDGAWRMGSKIC